MSRRKQAKPIRHSDEFGIEQCLSGKENGGSYGTGVGVTESGSSGLRRSLNDEFMLKGSYVLGGEHSGTSVSGSVSPTQDESGAESEQEQDDQRQYDDCTNNNRSRKREREFDHESSDDENRVPETTSEALRMANPFLNGNALEAAYSPFLPPATNIANVNNALDALQSTRMAIAQFAATAFSNGVQNSSSLHELTTLQSTLYALHQQQFLQMQLINQLQQQLQVSGTDKTPPPDVTKPVTKDLDMKQEQTESKFELPPPKASPKPAKIDQEATSHQEPHMSLADSILQSSEPFPAPDAPSTLEMLQRSTQQVLNNASQGLLASNLADELGFRATSSISSSEGRAGRDGVFKHRCRYCGKVFSSDSALQIHIRSHTGERPFKCNICGNRFTTKGNLKVHFQRHTARFPHVKMNPHPVPEHLDRFHPPLLSQLEMDDSSPNGAKSPGLTGPVQNSPLAAPGHNFPRPPMGLLPNFPSPLYRSFNPDLIRARHQLIFNPEILEKEETTPRLPEEQEIPQNLSKLPISEGSIAESTEQTASPELKKPEVKTEEVEEKKDAHREEEQREESFLDADRSFAYDDCSVGSKYSSDDGMNQGIEDEEGLNESSDDIPENLSSKSLQQQHLLPSFLPPHFRFPMGMSMQNSPMQHPIHQLREDNRHPFFRTSQGPILLTPDVDPAKDPAIYTNLLPRPGSNDNAWESLIEVTKASETTKLQQLVDNIENKLTDPNQCIICHRVLSCKSALQMHYRTHTGERPFKCKICGRAFTTKGNLKTHMGVHRAKPPTRLLHICPVCHRKFTNGIVLQQHIRLHTGEPTDLTLEQIEAAEVRDFPMFPMGYPNPFLLAGMPPFGLRLPMEHGEKALSFCVNQSDKRDVRCESPQESNASEAPLPISSPAVSDRHARQEEDRKERDDKKMRSSVSESESSQSDEYRAKSSQGSFTPLDLTSMGQFASMALQGSGKSPRSSPLSSLTNASLPPTTFNPLNLPVAPGRGNTTCNICFKTFACHSALEIHYRSHTKERPFKCTVCDRGFSTKGNMKQHLMTHKGMDGEYPKHSQSLPPSEDRSRDDRPCSQQSLPETRVNVNYEINPDVEKEKMQFAVFAQFRHNEMHGLTSPGFGYWDSFNKDSKRFLQRISPQETNKDSRADEQLSPSSSGSKTTSSPDTDYPKSSVYDLTAGPTSELDLTTKRLGFSQHSTRHAMPLPLPNNFRNEQMSPINPSSGRCLTIKPKRMSRRNSNTIRPALTRFE